MEFFWFVAYKTSHGKKTENLTSPFPPPFRAFQLHFLASARDSNVSQRSISSLYFILCKKYNKFEIWTIINVHDPLTRRHWFIIKSLGCKLHGYSTQNFFLYDCSEVNVRHNNFRKMLFCLTHKLLGSFWSLISEI